ncbi:hypothetical protein DFH07DRAFT_968077 [Mycena maculata]|uniref:Uncharacterized protein n=1 Tax=Mycena maculata TaxID=230809 RepID=A0AAD7MV18_9AGAR|nr:hypothetical protein DFH07DRAFT_968077 [Mycena maculata]
MSSFVGTLSCVVSPFVCAPDGALVHWQSPLSYSCDPQLPEHAGTSSSCDQSAAYKPFIVLQSDGEFTLFTLWRASHLGFGCGSINTAVPVRPFIGAPTTAAAFSLRIVISRRTRPAVTVTRERSVLSLAIVGPSLAPQHIHVVFRSPARQRLRPHRFVLTAALSTSVMSFIVLVSFFARRSEAHPSVQITVLVLVRHIPSCTVSSFVLERNGAFFRRELARATAMLFRCPLAAWCVSYSARDPPLLQRAGVSSSFHPQHVVCGMYAFCLKEIAHAAWQILAFVARPAITTTCGCLSTPSSCMPVLSAGCSCLALSALPLWHAGIPSFVLVLVSCTSFAGLIFLQVASVPDSTVVCVFGIEPPIGALLVGLGCHRRERCIQRLEVPTSKVLFPLFELSHSVTSTFSHALFIHDHCRGIVWPEIEHVSSSTHHRAAVHPTPSSFQHPPAGEVTSWVAALLSFSHGPTMMRSSPLSLVLRSKPLRVLARSHAHRLLPPATFVAVATGTWLGHTPLFVYRTPSGWMPLTKDIFLRDLPAAFHDAVLDLVFGHSFRIGGSLELLAGAAPKIIHKAHGLDVALLPHLLASLRSNHPLAISRAWDACTAEFACAHGHPVNSSSLSFA